MTLPLPMWRELSRCPHGLQTLQCVKEPERVLRPVCTDCTPGGWVKINHNAAAREAAKRGRR